MLGFSITLILHAVGAFSALATMSVVISLFISICWYIEGLLNDLVSILAILDVLEKEGRCDDMDKLFKDAILFHNDIIKYEIRTLPKKLLFF